LTTLPEPRTRPPGRPRSVEADRLILSAALEAFIQEGYAGMSMEGVAARAGVGKTTIYRRWPSKQELLVAAIETLFEEFRVVDTGDLRADLTSIARQAQHFLTETKAGEVLPRMVVEVTGGTQLGRAYFEKVMMPRLQAARAVLEGAMSRGELRRDLDVQLALAAMVGSLMFLRITHTLPGDPAVLAEKLVGQLMEGLR
jgi:AcrR family transcriptional regulator